MPHPRPFRFGVQLHGGAGSGDWRADARRVEDMGFSTVFLPDHFGDQLAPGPALMAAADATTDLRIGVLVYDNDYRHPVVLAKEVATLDVLSGGRVELGVGAGWMTSDYEQSGIPLDPPGVRIDRMVEGLQVLKGLFADGQVDFAGTHYRVTALDGRPKPVQRPHPPLIVGGGGRRVLSIAGREADIVGINPTLTAGHVGPEAARDAVAEATDRKVAWVKEAAGDRFDDLELNMLVFFTSVTDDRDGVRALMAPGFGIGPEEAADVPHAWVGTVDQICEDLERWRERWHVSYWVVHAEDLDGIGPVVDRLAGR